MANPPAPSQFRHVLVAMLGLVCTGCGVERTLTIESDPPGAMVTLNDQEIGRTPVTRDFVWYGTYDVELREDGYKTLKTTGQVWAPWWQVPPIDLAAELAPMQSHDHHVLHYTLLAEPDTEPNPLGMLVRAERLRGRLAGSESGRPTTRPAFHIEHPTTAAASKPATVP
jgi:PEGA domain